MLLYTLPLFTVTSSQRWDNELIPWWWRSKGATSLNQLSRELCAFHLFLCWAFETVPFPTALLTLLTSISSSILLLFCFASTLMKCTPERKWARGIHKISCAFFFSSSSSDETCRWQWLCLYLLPGLTPWRRDPNLKWGPLAASHGTCASKSF